ncbi:LysR family transcriptional regulator [Novosphingobium sp. BL-52-GroH]|uniref:LysR family transcriptional regulator n=1 Tax=Novosphingobium sp. BL-52-GroH TaxID=3349877 RepID=UPI00384E2D26
MELRQLRQFLAVIKHGSINRAAAALNLTQPSLSHSIKALERSVGAQLLIRGGGGIRPTEIGVVFIRYAKNILREAEKAQAEVSMMRGGGVGKLSIGTLSVFIPRFMPKVVSAFMETSADIVVDAFTFTYNSGQVFNDILSSEWDLALTLMGEDFDPPPEIRVQALGDYPSSVYCSPSHPLAGQRDVSLDQLAAAHWVVTNVGSAENMLRHKFAEREHEALIRMRVNSMNFAIAAARSSGLLCIAPDEAVADEIRDGRLVRVDQSTIAPTAQIALLHSNLSERTAAMRQFMSCCASHAATLKA